VKGEKMIKQTFVNVCKQNGFTEAEADCILKEYMKRKVVKYNAHDFYTVSHGIFMEKEPMQKALHFYKNTPTK